MGSRRYSGLQVKTAGWDATHQEERVYFRRSSFRAAPSTHVAFLGWNRAARAFAEDCLLIPSADVPSLAREEGEWMVLEVEPSALRHRRLDRYRTPLASLGATVEEMLA
jgi:hypothetical protein